MNIPLIASINIISDILKKYINSRFPRKKITKVFKTPKDKMSLRISYFVNYLENKLHTSEMESRSSNGPKLTIRLSSFNKLKPTGVKAVQRT